MGSGVWEFSLPPSYILPPPGAENGSHPGFPPPPLYDFLGFPSAPPLICPDLTGPYFVSFGRTGLRKTVYEAKFDVEADFDVKKSLAPPKSAENHEKPKKIAKNIPKKSFSASKKSKVANRPKRVFLKFRADRSQVRGGNERSKFEFLWSNTNFLLF